MDHPESLRAKILTRDELLKRRAEARAQGRTVVQCHGCFDIVHPGHVRHLQFAASQGDVLLVTITADSVMKKGTGRPLIPQELRAENLAALDSVDWVYVNPHETAEELLEEVRPDSYIKGKEYENNRDMRFAAERAAVERHGGRVVFSSGDVVFSSTALVAALEHSADPFHARLRTLVESHGFTPDRADALVESFRGTRVCVIGEAITDTYVLCDRPVVAGESPVMSLRPLEQRSYDGGAAIVARHLAAMGAKPILVTALPRSTAAESLRQRLTAEGVDVRFVDTETPMLEKQRFLVGAQKVMKLDLVRPITLDAGARQRLVSLATESATGCDAAIICDFGNGLLSGDVIGRLCQDLRQRVSFLAGDVSGRRAGLLQMWKMDLLCPTEVELREATHDYDDSLNAVVWKLIEFTQTKHAFVTLGADGLIAFDRIPGTDNMEGWASRLRGEHVPAVTPFAIDPLGCGDALLATSVLALVRGADITTAGLLGSVAAGVQAQRLGNEVISAADLRAGVRRLSHAKLAVGTPGTARIAV
ncbi:MAG TPA: PfkB family carbohydrate kinase [Phycisphaerales bacterium]|nr:PfkB family carbohydrate kinase [Phycisphaerales bacterium]